MFFFLLSEHSFSLCVRDPDPSLDSDMDPDLVLDHDMDLNPVFELDRDLGPGLDINRNPAVKSIGILLFILIKIRICTAGCRSESVNTFTRLK